MTDQSELLAEVAQLYYIDQLTQSEIARQIHVSRSTVSRLLKEARNCYIVEIKIHQPWERNSELESSLKKRFHLKEVRVLSSRNRDTDEKIHGMGILTAELLENTFPVRSGMIVGIGAGCSVAAAVNAIKPQLKTDVSVVPIQGAFHTNNPNLDSADLCRQFAHTYGGKYCNLPSPLMVKDAYTHYNLICNPQIRDSLSKARKASLLLLGINSFDAENAAKCSLLHLNHEECDKLNELGATGTVLGQCFDSSGKLIELDINHSFIGLELEALRNIPTVVAIAGGEPKARAILAALRGKFINTLVTDDSAALAVLKLADEP